ncbi:ammonium transporter Rh type C isoform X1 [Hydra vulgaris]|uniref:ammonium transporter Rh type C isoform X1 n=1 Tax=Hydra vulgaris TaxID=6087 RepID=UPI000192536B|nr:ammonium transporter Rh type C [Hydra vulgaris]XP_047146518.1 ammonium transporter Rh type C [Hydra vulgaris]
MEFRAISFPVALLLFQVLLICLYAGFVNYDESGPLQDNINYYPVFQDVHVMIIIGFGFLMTFLKRYGYGAVSYNLLLAAVTIQWSILLNAWVSNQTSKFKGKQVTLGEVKLGLKDVTFADISCTPILITFGAILGKASHLQLFVIAIIETIIYVVNNNIITDIFETADAGGTVSLHLFGAYFGLAVAFVLKNSGDPYGKESSSYNSDIFSMIGTLFLWVFWPSFNAGTLVGKPLQINRAVINTYIALAAGAVTSFGVSSLVNKSYKFKMVLMQNATIAAGVAVGISSDLLIRPWGAMLIGLTASTICVLGFTYLTPRLNKLSIHDTCGVHNLHGMPALFGACCAAICAIAIPPGKYSAEDFKSIYTASAERSPLKQGGFQFAAIIVTLAFAIICGLITGYIITFLKNPPEENRYDDAGEFEVMPEQTIQYERITDEVNITMA